MGVPALIHDEVFCRLYFSESQGSLKAFCYWFVKYFSECDVLNHRVLGGDDDFEVMLP
jgi:hypothetical protein